MDKRTLKVACEDIGIYHASNLLSNDIMEIVIISKNNNLFVRDKVYNIKRNKIFKIDYPTTSRLFIEGKGFVTYGICSKLLSSHINSENLIGNLPIVKKINEREGIVSFKDLMNLQTNIDNAIQYEK